MTEKPKKPPVKLTEKQREALDKGRKQLTKGDERTKVIQAQGVEAAVKARQEKAQARTFAQHLAEELELLNKDGEPLKREIARKFIQQVKNASPKTAAKLFEVLRDTLGEAPIQKVDINANVTNIGNWRDKLPTSATSSTDAAATPAEADDTSGSENPETDAGKDESEADGGNP